MSKFFINRPIVAMVISIIMVIVGVASRSCPCPSRSFPNIAPPEIQVQATYVGADALTVEQSVATPIEQQMSGVDNMNYMYSLNANNGADDADRRLRRQHRPEHRPDPRADAASAGRLATAGRRQQLWRHRQEIAPRRR